MATEVKVLDGVLASSNLTGATVGNLNAQDTNWAVATANNVATSVRASTPTPTGPPNAGANLQTITVQTRKNSSNSGTPTATISVGVGGTKILTSSSFNVTSTTGQVNTFTFDFSAVTGAAADGSDLEIWVDTVAAGGNPSTRNSVDIGYVAWTVDYSTSVALTIQNAVSATLADNVTLALPLVSTLTDNFDDNSQGAQWTLGFRGDPAGFTEAGVTIAETGGRVELTFPANDATKRGTGYVSAGEYDMREGSISIRVDQAPGPSQQIYLGVAMQDAGNTYMVIIDGTQGNIRLFKRVASAAAVLLGTATTYNFTNHRWIRLRHSSGNVFLDVAPDTASNPPSSGDWTNLTSGAEDGALNLQRAHPFFNGTVNNSVASPTQAIFDGFNTTANSGVALTIQDANSATLADNLTLSGNFPLTIQDANSATLADNLNIGPLIQTDVVIMIGESNTCGARNDLTELPTGYYSTDNNAFIWDDAEIGGTGAAIRALVPGPMEQQPGGAAYLDPSYTNTVGPCGEFIKHYRADNPSTRVDFFISQQGGGRFSDAASRGRAANYDETLSDGAYNEMLVSWTAYVAALEAQGRTPNIIACRINLGGNTSSDATESSNFQSDLTSFIAQLRTDVIGNAKVVLDRYGGLQSGFDQTNMATVRTAVENIVTADPTRVELMSIAGMPCGADNIHLTAAAHISVGEQFYYHAAGLWYPQKEQSFNGGNPVAHEWRLGDFRNTIASSTLTTGDVTTCFDCTGNGFNPTQATSTKRPAISTVACPNGYTARVATGDGVDDVLVHTGASMFDGTYGVFGSIKGPANNGGCVIGEGGSTILPFVEPIKSDSSGNLQWFWRDDNDVVTGPTTLVSGVFDNSWHAVAVWDNASAVNSKRDSTSGTTLNYTRTTTTVSRMSLFALNYNNGGSELHYSNASVGILWTTEAVPDATYQANALAYMQRRWATITGGTSLVVQNAVSAGVLENLTLAPQTPLILADAVSATLADNLDLSSNYVLTVADAVSAGILENLTLATGNTLGIADAVSAGLVDNIDLVQHYVLVVSNAVSATLADNLILAPKTSLLVENAVSATLLDNLTLGVTGTLGVADAVSAAQSDNVVLAPKTTITIASATSASQLDAIVLAPKTTLTVASALSATLADNLILSPKTALVVASATSASQLDALALTYKVQLSIDNAVSPTLLSSLTLGLPFTPNDTPVERIVQPPLSQRIGRVAQPTIALAAGRVAIPPEAVISGRKILAE